MSLCLFAKLILPDLEIIAKIDQLIYHSTEMDGAIQYGHPGKKPPLWLHGIMKNEMRFFNSVMHGEPVPDEFKPLLNGRAARAAIATADAATRSLRENRKVKVEEIIG